MATVVVAALIGLVAGLRRSPLGLIIAAALVGLLAMVVAVANWSAGGLIEAAMGIVAFNAVAMVTIGVRLLIRRARRRAELERVAAGADGPPRSERK